LVPPEPQFARRTRYVLNSNVSIGPAGTSIRTREIISDDDYQFRLVPPEPQFAHHLIKELSCVQSVSIGPAGTSIRTLMISFIRRMGFDWSRRNLNSHRKKR